MATTVAKIRLVRCPKCLKLLPEMADVPMYQCGGCGAILKAKNYDSSNQNVSLISESDVSQNLSHNDSSNESQVIGESSNAGEIDITSDAKVSSSKTKSEESFKEEAADRPSVDSEERPDQSHGASSSDLSQNVQIDNLTTSTVSFSDDNRSENGIRDKHRNLSRRTVRDRRFSSSKDGGMSLDSDPFYSIRSWVESDKDNGPSRSLSRREDPTKNQIGSSSKSFKNRELLKLVEEFTDQLGRSYELKKKKSFPCSRNKARSSKSYTRPVSGGAPFVICRKCFEVLHLPADFLISRSRLSKLKCGSCSEVMALSFPALNCNEAGNPTEGPDSFSEEYGISFADTSSSMGTEAMLNVSKASSQMGIEEKGTLHQLMGYPSARVLLFENSKSLK